MGHFSIICKGLPVKTVQQVLETEDALSPTNAGGVTAATCTNTPISEPVANLQTGRSNNG